MIELLWGRAEIASCTFSGKLFSSSPLRWKRSSKRNTLIKIIFLNDFLCDVTSFILSNKKPLPTKSCGLKTLVERRHRKLFYCNFSPAFSDSVVISGFFFPSESNAWRTLSRRHFLSEIKNQERERKEKRKEKFSVFIPLNLTNVPMSRVASFNMSLCVSICSWRIN